MQLFGLILVCLCRRKAEKKVQQAKASAEQTPHLQDSRRQNLQESEGQVELDGGNCGAEHGEASDSLATDLLEHSSGEFLPLLFSPA